MRQALYILLVLVALSSMAVQAESRNVPSRSDVVKALEAAGSDHYPVKEIKQLIKRGSSKVDDTYVHIYVAVMESGNYRVLFFNNQGKYLGYLPSTAEIADVQDGLVLFATGLNGSGNDEVPLSTNGPPVTVDLNGIYVQFVKAPEKAAAEKTK